jgi:hypothetical protein
MAASGWHAEPGQSKPTQKQKVRHILRSRRLGATAARAPEQAVELIDEKLAAFTRSVSERSSVSTHIAADRTEGVQLKLYVDSVLSELLEIHSSVQA